MRKTTLCLPVIALLAGTRAALGAGVGLLLAPRLEEEKRKKAGWALLLGGAVTTLPLLMEVRAGSRAAKADDRREG